MNKIVNFIGRRAFFGAMLLLCIICQARGQKPDYRVVFDLTSRDTADHNSVIRWIREITASNPDARIEVVFYGGSLGMVMKGRSTVADAVSTMIASGHVQFNVCAQAMRNHHVAPEELISGVDVVPDGIYEIISKERQGWGYIKAGH